MADIVSAEPPTQVPTARPRPSEEIPNDDWTPVSPRESRVTYEPGSWHNRSGEIIRNLAADVWVIERGYVHFGMDVGGKTTIFRLPDKRLFVHCPLPLNASLKQAIKSLGTVSAVVAGNAQHLDFIASWKKHFPDAEYLAPPGVMAKRPDVPFTAELHADNSAHPSFADEAGTIKQMFIDCAPAMDEAIFFHSPSKIITATDIFMSIPNDNVPFMTRFANVFLDLFFKPVYANFLVKDKNRFEECMQTIEAWNFERIVPCHGDIITNDAMIQFRQFWGR